MMRRPGRFMTVQVTANKFLSCCRFFPVCDWDRDEYMYTTLTISFFSFFLSDISGSCFAPVFLRVHIRLRI